MLQKEQEPPSSNPRIKMNALDRLLQLQLQLQQKSASMGLAFCDECYEYIPTPTVRGPHPKNPQQPLYLCADCAGETRELRNKAQSQRRYPSQAADIQYHGQYSPY